MKRYELKGEHYTSKLKGISCVVYSSPAKHAIEVTQQPSHYGMAVAVERVCHVVMILEISCNDGFQSVGFLLETMDRDEESGIFASR